MLLVTVAIAGLSLNAAAQPTSSAGCDNLNGVDLDAQNPVRGIGNSVPRAFFAGDTISATVNPPTALGTPDSIELLIDGSRVDSDGFPGSLTYLIPTDGDFLVLMRTNAAEATWTLTCSQSAASQTVPTIGIWGIGMLIGLIGVLGMYQRRR